MERYAHDDRDERCENGECHACRKPQSKAYDAERLVGSGCRVVVIAVSIVNQVLLLFENGVAVRGDHASVGIFNVLMTVWLELWRGLGS